MKTLLYIILTLFCFLSCKKAGESPIDKTINTAGYNKLIIHDSFDVFIEESNENSIKFSADAKIVDKLEFEIQDSILHIYNNKKQKWLYPKIAKAKVYIKSKSLSSVELKETCLLKTINPITKNDFTLICKSKLNNAELELNCNHFTFWNNFPTGGKVKLIGNAQKLSLFSTAIIAVDAKDVLTMDADIDNNSKADISINCSNKLTYKLRSEGNIHSYKTPNELVNLESTGKGSYIQK